MKNTKLSRTKKLTELKGTWSDKTLKAKIKKSKFKQPSDNTLDVLYAYFVDGLAQHIIVKDFDMTRQSVSNVLVRFMNRLS